MARSRARCASTSVMSGSPRWMLQTTSLSESVCTTPFFVVVRRHKMALTHILYGYWRKFKRFPMCSEAGSRHGLIWKFQDLSKGVHKPANARDGKISSVVVLQRVGSMDGQGSPNPTLGICTTPSNRVLSLW